jgi:hypothetical protein
MKLRIRGDSIRLRLTVAEVERIRSGDSVTETTHFPGATMSYSVEVADIDNAEARMEGSCLTVRLPRQQGIEWAGSDTVSLFAEQDLGDAGTLSLLVEKDFKCLAPGEHRHEADDEGTFPHPNA